MHKCFIFCGVLFVLMTSTIFSQDYQRLSNASIVKQLCDSLNERAAVEASLPHTSSLSVTLTAGSVYSLARQSAMEILQNYVSNLFFLDTADITANILFSPPVIRYSEPLSDGFFSSSKVQRSISVEAIFSFEETATRKLVWAGTIQKSFSDTLLFSDIDNIEQNGVIILKGERKPRKIFDSILDPLIITAATGIAIYLFFTIRS